MRLLTNIIQNHFGALLIASVLVPVIVGVIIAVVNS
jgi:hypothetical protein